MTALNFHFHKVSDWQWILNHIGHFWALSQTHLYIALVSVLLALLISLPLGVIAARVRGAYQPLLAITTVLYSIPAIAAFAFLIVLTRLTDTTVIIPLTAYACAILIRNVADGIRGVPDEVRLSAAAMGYRPFRQLVTVELPTAIPVILAGLRVATVSSISLVTVGALIGIGGLGQLFTDGENTDFITEILVGVVLVVWWALVCDALLLLAGRAATPWTRRAGS
jgi:osmoprotectant transport system permease protein